MADNNSNELDALMISELPTQATANETDLFEVAIVDANSASGYASKKESAAAIADAIVGEYQYPLRITGTTAKTIAGAINELKNLVDLLPQFAIEVVNTLPVSDISETTIYLVPASDPEQGNYYEEYIYVNNAWELVGTTAVDLSGYYTSAQVDTLLAAKANTSSLATVATSGAYSDLTGKPTIDTALDDTSTNAVENRAVASEINSIKSDITVDGSASGDIATFVDGSDNPLKALKISIVAQQSGSGDPSPDNERPISGFNAVNVGDISDTEKVQYFKGLLDGTYGFVDLGSFSWNYLTTTETPVFQADVIDAKKPSIACICPNYTTKLNFWNYTGNDKCVAFSSVRLNISDSAYTDATAFKTAMDGVYLIYELETPTTPTITPTEFNTLVSAFGLQGWLVQIAMSAEAGTVYGGTLDVKTGLLTITHASVTYNGTENWATGVSAGGLTYFYLGLPSTYRNDVLPIVNWLKGELTGSVDTDREWTLRLSSSRLIILKADAAQTITTMEQLNAVIANNHIKVVYGLTTPITYQLTPTEIRSLLGTNNVWADCGAITELKYTRDLNLALQNKVLYSRDKRKVGTWLDGRGIYEEVIEFTNTTASFSDFIDIATIPDIDFPLKIEWGANRYTNNKYYYYTGNGASITESSATYYILTRVMGQTLQYRIGGYGTQIGKMCIMITYVERGGAE